MYHPVMEKSLKSREIFERLVEEGFLKNSCKLYELCYWSNIPRFLRYICCMKKLQSLHLDKCQLTLEQLSTLFRSCPELVELNLGLDLSLKSDMDEHLKNELRRGFEKLRLFVLNGYINNDSWPVIQEIMS
jgi:hypothetical protein